MSANFKHKLASAILIFWGSLASVGALIMWKQVLMIVGFITILGVFLGTCGALAWALEEHDLI